MDIECWHMNTPKHPNLMDDVYDNGAIDVEECPDNDWCGYSYKGID